MTPETRLKRDHALRQLLAQLDTDTRDPACNLIQAIECFHESYCALLNALPDPTKRRPAK